MSVSSTVTYTPHYRGAVLWSMDMVMNGNVCRTITMGEEVQHSESSKKGVVNGLRYASESSDKVVSVEWEDEDGDWIGFDEILPF